MRILFILHQFYPEFSSGTEHVTLNLARCAQRAGHYVQVLACVVDPAACYGRRSSGIDGALEITYHGVPVMLLPRELLPVTADCSFEIEFNLAESLANWIRLERFDIAHVLHQMRMGTALLAVQRCGLPYIVTLTDFFSACFRINLINLHNDLCLGPDEGMRCGKDCLVVPWTKDALIGRYKQARNLLAAAGIRVCPSNYVAERYRSIFPGLGFIVIPHGMDILALLGNKLTTISAATNDNITLGFIGSIIPQKGVDILLRAFIRVPDPRLKLRVVGGFYGSNAYRNEVIKLVKADSRIELVGQVSPQKVFEIIREINVLCLPSRVPEAFSMVLHEASALGVPAIVPDLGAPAEYVAKHGDGFVLPANDIESWVDVIGKLLDYPELLYSWRSRSPVPFRVEEEAFFYESLYRRLIY